MESEEAKKLIEMQYRAEFGGRFEELFIEAHTALCQRGDVDGVYALQTHLESMAELAGETLKRVKAMLQGDLEKQITN